MDFNFFNWIRDGVKRSVLLGVSDAVQTIGMPQDEESSKDKILSFLQNDEAVAVAGSKRRITGGTATTGQRKLGRSITDIHSVKD